MRVVSVGRALPRHYYDQQQLLAAFRELWGPKLFNPRRLEQIHHNVKVGGRYLALPLEAYPTLKDFTAANQAYVEQATDLGVAALDDALTLAGAEPNAIDHLFFLSVTGVAAPSIDARMANRMGLRRDIKRTPIFGLGCVGGAAGVARAMDYVKAYPHALAAVVTVELCSLTLQRDDLSMANLISGGLFGDGAAAVIVVGQERAKQFDSAAERNGGRI